VLLANGKVAMNDSDTRLCFVSVRYLHGVREYGKDFTFSELSPFSRLGHYGLQARARDISGEVNSAIDEIIGQAKCYNRGWLNNVPDEYYC
jgi:hypothetical protein